MRSRSSPRTGTGRSTRRLRPRTPRKRRGARCPPTPKASMQYDATGLRPVRRGCCRERPYTVAKGPRTRGRPAPPERGTFCSAGSKGVEYGTDDADARIAELPDHAGRVGKTGVVLAGEHYRAACPESHVLGVRVELRRWRVEEDDVELGPHLLQESAEHGTRKQLLWIGRGCAGGQEREHAEFPDRGDGTAVGAARKYRRKADPVGNVEDSMLSRRAQVGIDQKRALAELRKDHGKVGRHVTAPFAGARTGDRERAVSETRLGPAHQQLGSQRPQLFGTGVKRFVSHDELAADAFVAWQQMGKIVLPGDSATQVVFRDQAQTKRRFAEPQSVRPLQLQDLLDAPGAKLSLLHENAADATIVLGENAPRSFDRQDIFLG